MNMKAITINPHQENSPLRDVTPSVPSKLPTAKETQLHPNVPAQGDENASIFFVGTATTIIEWAGLRIMTDPNFLHKGDHVHLGPGVTATRQTNPAVDLRQLPRIDLVLLSHYHADHFDAEVEASLRRDLPIITTQHAKECLVDKKRGGTPAEEPFNNVHAVDTWESIRVDIDSKAQGQHQQKTGQTAREAGNSTNLPAIKVTAAPGKHVPPGPLSVANDILGAVPPTNGWVVDLGYTSGKTGDAFESGYRIYITGDTLMYDDIKDIPKRYAPFDLLLLHLGGTTIPSPSLPLLMVTMDAKQGIEMVRVVNPDVAIPIHYDDYDVFLSPLSDFKALVEKDEELKTKVVYLDRGDAYKFRVKGT